MGLPRKKQREILARQSAASDQQLAFVDVFTGCQHGLHDVNKHLKAMRSLYEKMNVDEFFKNFIHCLKYAMVVYKREPAVERIIEFATRFVVSVTKAQVDSTSETGATTDLPLPTDNMLLDRIFNFLLQMHGTQEKAVRFRCCQLVSKLLAAMGEDAQIDDELYERIYEAMLLRMRDKSYAVRVQAIQALSRLQDPTNKDCPIVKAYLFLMTCDPNPDVRRAALSVVAVTRKTLHAIIERTRDTKETVRRTAFMVLNDKVGVKALSIAQRVDLLQAGLTDRCESVRTVCGQRLLPSWLRSFKGSLLELLQGLDVENSSETCDLAMSALLSKTGPDDMLSAFNLLNSRLVIDISQLSCESVFYWRTVCNHFHKLGPAGDIYLEKLLPTASAFVAYIKTVFAELIAADVAIEKQLSNDFILQQLFNMVKLLDLSDEAGRKEALKLIVHVLKCDKTASSLLKPVIECLAKIVRNPEQRAREVCELVAEICEPTELIEEMISHEERHQLELKLADVRVALLRTREELEDFVQKQQYEEAAKIKSKISQLETEKAAIFQQMQPRLKEQKRAESDSTSTMLRCTAIVGEYLLAPDVEQISSGIRMSLDEMILPGIQNEDPALRNAAVRALGLVCLMDADLARKHFLLFMQAAQIDQEEVKVSALTAVFDMILAFGMENFQVSDSAKGNIDTAGDDRKDSDDDSCNDADSDILSEQPLDAPTTTAAGSRSSSSSSITKILMSFFDNECCDVRTLAAEGVAKLLLSGRLLSSTALSRLLLLWYNPLTEDDARLRHCLGAFFPMFAFASRANQELYERAFLPTLQTIFDAPNSSPLANIDAGNVAELLVQLTSARHLVGNTEQSQSSPVHDSLAFKLCDEILRAPNSLGVRVLTRALAQLQLSLTDEVLSKGFAVLLGDVLQVVKDKLSVKYLLKLKEKVNAVRTEQARVNAENLPSAVEPTEPNQTQEVDDSIIQEPVASFLTEPNLDRMHRAADGGRQTHRTGRKLANTTIASRSSVDELSNVTLLADSSELSPTPRRTPKRSDFKKPAVKEPGTAGRTAAKRKSAVFSAGSASEEDVLPTVTVSPRTGNSAASRTTEPPDQQNSADEEPGVASTACEKMNSAAVSLEIATTSEDNAVSVSAESHKNVTGSTTKSKKPVGRPPRKRPVESKESSSPSHPTPTPQRMSRAVTAKAAVAADATRLSLIATNELRSPSRRSFDSAGQAVASDSDEASVPFASPNAPKTRKAARSIASTITPSTASPSPRSITRSGKPPTVNRDTDPQGDTLSRTLTPSASAGTPASAPRSSRSRKAR